MKKFILFCICAFAINTIVTHAQIITTVAGNGAQGYTGNGGQATAAELSGPNCVAFDALGNYYISDETNNVIRKVDISTGIITTIAGTGAGGYSGDGGQATSARLSWPIGVVIDTSGNIYIGDFVNNAVRKVNGSTGIITTIAGTGAGGYNGDNIQATLATLNGPRYIALDKSLNVYIADALNNRIRKIDVTTGLISTVAGNGTGSFSGDGGMAVNAELNYPYGVALDDSNNIFIADQSNNRIRRVTALSGKIFTIAGNGTAGYSGDGGPATSAELNIPDAITIGAGGDVLISGTGDQTIRKVNKSTGIITKIAGIGTVAGFSGDGGPATSAEFHFPAGVTLDKYGSIYVPDWANSRVRKITGTLSVSGSGGSTCKNSCSGTAKVTPNGGTPPYTYSWSNGETTQVDTGLCAGVYSVTVTDFSGNKVIITDTVISNPLPVVSLSYQSNDTVCSGAGTIKLFGSPLGGTYRGSAVYGSFFYPDSAWVGKNNLFAYSYTNSYGCTSSITDSIFVDNCLGMAELTMDNEQLTIEPNPSTGKFSIVLNEAKGNVIVTLYTITGKEVMQQSYSEQQTITENISALAPGNIYFKGANRGWAKLFQESGGDAVAIGNFPKFVKKLPYHGNNNRNYKSKQ